jgi:hypothetical protein
MPGDNLHQPDCRLFSELEYSFHAFEHLEVRKVVQQVDKGFLLSSTVVQQVDKDFLLSSTVV